MATRTQLEQCVHIVRRLDPVHFMCSTFLPVSQRANAFALHALNCELDQVLENNKKAKFASLKMKWWIDAINKVCMKNENIPHHPVVLSLQDIASSRTSSYLLSKLVNEKRRKAEEVLKITKTIDTLEQHVDSVYSSLYSLILESAEVSEAECHQSASHIGKAVGLTRILMSIPQDAMKDKVFLPTDLCLKHKVNYGDVTAGYNSENLAEVVFQVASRAKMHLIEGQKIHQSLPNDKKVFFLPVIPALKYLQLLEKYEFQPFTSELHDNALRSLMLQCSLAWNAFRGTIG